jgi:hypothetical protein
MASRRHTWQYTISRYSLSQWFPQLQFGEKRIVIHWAREQRVILLHGEALFFFLNKSRKVALQRRTACGETPHVHGDKEIC